MYIDKAGRPERKKGKVLIVASVASMIEQFNIPNIRLLISLGYETDVACNFQKGSTCSDEKIKELLNLLEQLQADCYQIDFERSPFDLKAAARAYRQLDRVLKGTARTIHGKQWHKDRKPYCFIHAHSPAGGMLGRIAAKWNHCRSIYTAHGFHFYQGAPWKNWLIYYTAEWMLSWITDILVTINREDYIRAKKRMHAKKTMYVHGIGIDFKKFARKPGVSKEKRASLGVKNTDIMLFSAGELIPRKNHRAVIEAVSLLHNQDIKYLIAGKGVLEQELAEQICLLGLEKQVFLLGYRTDIPELYQAADLFVFPSRQEGLPAALMEAMASRTPVICSNIRGNTDLVKNHESLFDENCPDEIAACIRQFAEKHSNQEKSAACAAAQNYGHLKPYRLDAVMDEMKTVYKTASTGGCVKARKVKNSRKVMG